MASSWTAVLPMPPVPVRHDALVLPFGLLGWWAMGTSGNENDLLREIGDLGVGVVAVAAVRTHCKSDDVGMVRDPIWFDGTGLLWLW